MRITINLATRPFADVGPAIKNLRIGMGVLAGVAVLLGVGLYAFHNKAEASRARERKLEGQIAAVTQERQGYQALMRQPANADVLAQAVNLNQLFDEKSFSWTLAMEDLETVLPGGVQVSTIEPVRAKDGQITLRLRVIGPRDRSVDLVRNLEHSRHFLRPRIVGETAESTGGPGEQLQPVSASNRVDFDVLADYNPATTGERKPAKAPPLVAASPEGQPAQPPTAQKPAKRPVPLGSTRPAAPVRPMTGISLPPQPGMKPGPYPGAPSNRTPYTGQPRQMPPGAHPLPRPVPPASSQLNSNPGAAQ